MEDPHDTHTPAGGLTIAGRFGSSPFCLHLQSKKRFSLRGEPLVESDVLDASMSCWCRKTMQALGPDGELVDPADCRAGRGCFESAF